MAGTSRVSGELNGWSMQRSASFADGEISVADGTRTMNSHELVTIASNGVGAQTNRSQYQVRLPQLRMQLIRMVMATFYSYVHSM